MKQQKRSNASGSLVSRQRGAAIITMLVVMALLLVLVTSIMLLSRSEMRSAATYESQVSADNLSEAATSLVISQIRAATENGSASWASQPGAVRNYDDTGEFLAGYKLYSDDDMVVVEENELIEDLIPFDWDQQPEHFVDLNTPSKVGDDFLFPIIDPRAMGQVEGFEFTEEVTGTIASEDETSRLPMPVRWIYMLQDGTTGHLNPDTGKFVGNRASGEAVAPDQANPIVGRFAFWTDDETSKININTASEPTFWDTPRSVSREDLWYARAQPTQKEYQRYPGHPATTALSPVLFGDKIVRKTLAQLDNGSMGSSKRLSSEMRENKAIKEAIYDLVPRVNVGGSEAGTRVNKRGDPGVEPDLDHLYASVDEFIFKAPRLETNVESREQSDVVDRLALERSRFFLTANSRAPELNLFGLPRVSIWPTDHESRPKKHHTTFDSLIRFCSTTSSGDKYFFTRRNADSATEDWNRIERNRDVYRYLQELLEQKIPGIGGSLASKWDEDSDQILTEIFDYIRCTNLFDDNHPELFYTGYQNTRNWQTQFTNGRTFRRKDGELVENFNGTHQGHGQVIPIKIGDTMGFGRFATFSEFGLVIICCAHPGEGDFPQRTGGERIEDPIWIRGPGNKGQIKVHYTNFPPLDPPPDSIDFDKTFNGTDYRPYFPVKDEKGQLRTGNDPNHPGYKPINWNHALPVWKNWHKEGSVPTNCEEDEMVIQVCFLPEAFIAAQGWSSFNSRIRTEIIGLNNLVIDDFPLEFHRDTERGNDKEKRVKNTSGGLSSGFHGRAWGGNAGFRGFSDFRLVSQPLKIKKTGKRRTKETLTLAQNGKISVSLFFDHDGDENKRVQNFELTFPEAEFPLPDIQKTGTRDRNGRRETSARFWWTFNNSRTLNAINDVERPYRNRPWQLRGQALVNGRKQFSPSGGKILENSNLVGAYHFGGRLSGKGSNPGSPWTIENNHSNDTETRNPKWKTGIHKGGFWRNGDVVRTLVPFHGLGDTEFGGDFRLVAATPEVTADIFTPHFNYFSLKPENRIDHTFYLPAGAHYYWGFGNADLHLTSDGLYPEFDYPVSTQLTDSSYHFSKFPDYPRGYSNFDSQIESPHIRTGDFDNGIALTVDGAFINKPDGGNRSDRWGVSRGSSFSDVPTPYFDNNWGQAIQGPGYFSPNRQISSPVMFGSLPTGVKREQAWQTLLFRPQPWGHPSDPELPHPGYEDPKDHYLLDLFWMPVVEPYAVSEPFSTAGKINMNYQILPFTHIKRATGLHAVLKAEEMLIISDEDAAHYKNWDHALADYYEPPLPDDVYLRHLIHIDETLKQFDDRFLNGEIFRSANEICDVHLIPLMDRPGQIQMELPEPNPGDLIRHDADMMMQDFWEAHSPTGDNSRERPYSNIYPRLTTKSNTFRVHVRAQAIKKARESDPETFDPALDSVQSEWRGESLLERYIDPNNKRIPDYATKRHLIGSENLDKFYQFRILYRNRFDG